MSIKNPGIKHCSIFPIALADLDATLQATISGSRVAVSKVGASYSVLSTDSVVLVTAVATISLPDVTLADFINKRITIKRIGASGVTTITPAGTQKIDGDSTYSLDAQYDFVTLANDGLNWYIVAHS